MRKRFVRALTAEERDELSRTYKRTFDADLARRCHAILLSADGKAIPEIAQLLRSDQSSIHRWLDRFEAGPSEGGMSALVIEWGSGRPPRWDEAYEYLLVETVRHNPRWHGLEQSIWTCRLRPGIWPSERALR